MYGPVCMWCVVALPVGRANNPTKQRTSTRVWWCDVPRARPMVCCTVVRENRDSSTEVSKLTGYIHRVPHQHPVAYEYMAEKILKTKLGFWSGLLFNLFLPLRPGSKYMLLPYIRSVFLRPIGSRSDRGHNECGGVILDAPPNYPIRAFLFPITTAVSVCTVGSQRAVQKKSTVRCW